MLKVCLLFLANVSLVFGQSVAVEQSHSLERIPGVEVKVVDRAVKHGDKEAGATLNYGSAKAHRTYTDWRGNRLTDMFFPQAGVYKETSAKLKGRMYDLTETYFHSPKAEDHTLFNGKTFYRWRTEPDQSSPLIRRHQVHVDSYGPNPIQLPLLGVFELEKFGDFKFQSTHQDKDFGPVRTFVSSEGSTASVAIDRDWMVVSLAGKGWVVKVLEMAVIDGHWMPTKILREGEGRNKDLDVYRRLEYKLRPKLDVPDFTPSYSANMTWMENGVLYDVVKNRLVKSSYQPSAGADLRVKLGAAVLILVMGIVLGLLGSNIYKLFGKSNGSLFDSVQGTKDDGKNV